MDNEHKRSIARALVVSRDTVVLWTWYKHGKWWIMNTRDQLRVHWSCQETRLFYGRVINTVSETHRLNTVSGVEEQQKVDPARSWVSLKPKPVPL